MELDDVSRQLDEARTSTSHRPRRVVEPWLFRAVPAVPAVPGADEAETAHGKVR